MAENGNFTVYQEASGNNNVVNVAFFEDDAQLENLLKTMTRTQLVDFAVGEFA